MIRYITLGSNDIARSRRFYDAALKPLGLVCNVVTEDEIAYGYPEGSGKDPLNRIWIVKPFMKLPANWGNGTMIALEAADHAAVDAFHKSGAAAGGIDDGAPGLRPYSGSFYAAYLRDPDGNKLSAVCVRD